VRLSYLIFLLALGLVGCASHDIRQLTPEDISTYKNRASQDGVSVAADVFDNKQKTEGAFTIDLTENGFVPILVIVDNPTKDNILLIKDDITLTDSKGNIRRPVPANIMVSKFEHNKIAYALLGFGLFSYISADEANRKMLQDWSSKELPAEKVMIPGRKSHGVAYFDLGQGLATLPNSTLAVPLLNMRTGERGVITLPLVQ